MGANLGAITNPVANQSQGSAGDGGLPFISDANGNLSPNPSYNPPVQQQLIMNGGQQGGGNPLYNPQTNNTANAQQGGGLSGGMTPAQGSNPSKYTDAQVASYIQNQNLNPQQAQAAMTALGVNSQQFQNAQNLINSNDPSIANATQAYQQSISGHPEMAASNTAYYNPITETGSAINPSASTNTNQNPWGITGANATNLQSSTNPYIQAAQQTSLGNLAGAQNATTANRVNQSTPYSNLNYTQTGTDANGNPIWSANQTLAGPLAGAQSNLAQGVANQAAQGFNPNTPSVGINPGQLYSDAIMQRLQPQQAHAQEQQAASLANQGIAPGTDAYNNAMRTFQQGQNDQLTSAQVGGIGVGLQANQQAFNQQLQQANLPYQQLGAFQQATQPGYVNAYNQQAVSGPDYTNAYSTAQNAQIAQQNQQIAQQANLQNGLFGLGSSAILGSGGVGNLASTIGNGATSAYNGLSSLFNGTPGLGQTTNALGQVITDPTYGQGGSAINYASQLGDVGNALGI